MAKKAIRKSNKKADEIAFNNSYNKIKSTANTINDQIVDTAKVVAEDVLNAGKVLTGDVYKMAASKINDVNFDSGIDMIKSNVKNVNEFALDTAEEIVEGAMHNGERVQEIAANAIKESLKLASKQQDVIFDTLDTVKKQVTKSTSRLVEMFS